MRLRQPAARGFGGYPVRIESGLLSATQLREHVSKYPPLTEVHSVAPASTLLFGVTGQSQGASKSPSWF